MLDLKIYFYTQHIVYEFQMSGFCLTKHAYQYIQCMYMYQVYLKHVYKNRCNLIKNNKSACMVTQFDS